MKRTVMIVMLCFIVFLPAWSSEGFSDIFGEEGAVSTEPAAGSGKEQSLSVSGEIGSEFVYYMDEAWESQVDVLTTADLDFRAATNSLEGGVLFHLEIEDLENQLDYSDILDSIYLRLFHSYGYIEAGLLKTEWGKGDGYHVIDPLNPLKQSGKVRTDLNAAKRAVLMATVNFYIAKQGLLELVYKPFFQPHEISAEGRWAVIDPAAIPGFGVIEPPDTGTLEYSQGAARITGCLGPVDLGALYYYGFFSEPGYAFTPTFTGTNPLDPGHYTTTADLVYTRAQLFGGEASAALGPFTLRTELGYWLSEDRDGTAPELYNDRFVYLGGADIMIPGTNFFISGQAAGTYVIDFKDLAEVDVDNVAAYGGTGHSLTLIGVAEFPFLRDTMNIRLSGLWLVQGKGYSLFPEYTWKLMDDFHLKISGQVFSGDTELGSPYSGWDANDNISVSLRYIF